MKGVKKMKKIILVLVVVLLGILLLSTINRPLVAEQLTLKTAIDMMNENFQKLTPQEMDLLYSRVTQSDIDDAIILIRQWGALCTVGTEIGRIILER